jgi:hypothetical protein
MLKRSGYSRYELKEGSEKATNIRRQREKSNKLTPRERFESWLKHMAAKRKRKETTDDETRLSDSIRNLSGITHEQAALSNSTSFRKRVATDQEVRMSNNIILPGMTSEQARLSDSMSNINFKLT